MSEDPRQYLNDNEEAQRLAMEGNQAGIWTAMPGIVQSVDLTKLTCVVQLAIQGRFEDPQGNVNFTNISILHDVPIVFPSAGGFALTMPIAANDEVLVVFASRCIDSWWQNGGYANKPMEFRMHDLSDGFAIPGPKSQPAVLTSVSTTEAQLRNQSGDAYISIVKATNKFGFQNSTTSLKSLLTDLYTALNAFATTSASATTAPQIATAAASLVTALTPINVKIGALLK